MLVMLLPSLLLAVYAQLLKPRVRQRLGGNTPRDSPWWLPDRGTAAPVRKQSTAPLYSRAADLDLLACCLRAGLSIAGASQIVADIAEDQSWHRVAVMLRSGLPATQAWLPMQADPELHEIATFMITSERSGAALSGNLENLARQLRERAQAQATAQAEKVNVLIALPLTLCYLPAFLLLGLAPVVVGLGMQVFGN